ncbi:MAG TPA: hypothetical protein VKA00_01825 [Trueperaceae bacterium]|nr:hypothetical protein [Trueperaceae bacterium]
MLLVASIASQVLLGASAQHIVCTPKPACTTPVLFAPTEAVYVAALGATLPPTSPTTPISFKVQTGNRNSVSAEVGRSPWTPAGGLELEARFTLSGPHVTTRVLDWMPVTAAPQALFSDEANQIDVAVEYRLAVSGEVPPGTYTSTVTYQAAGDPGGSLDSITNTFTVTIPAYISVRFGGLAPGQIPTIDFAYGGANVDAYLEAVVAHDALPPTAATFATLEVATNSPGGYRIAITVSAIAAPAQSSLTVSNIDLLGRAADGRTIDGDGPTNGFVTVLRAHDFALKVSGAEAPGFYAFEVAYGATPLP